jgi:DNA-binding transcriptional LysR family regulator
MGRLSSISLLNIHHLELFYYVARHGGISRAVQHMPYGIQQPTISSQMSLLEGGLGTKLFERSPFRLTAAGVELFAFVRPFFDNLDTVEARLQKQAAPQIRIGASEFVLREYLPSVIKLVRRRYPEVRLSMQSGFSYQLEAMLLDRQIDLAIDPLENRPARLHCLPLMRVPLVLLVHRKSKLKSSAELWARRRIEEPLITLPTADITSKLFKRGLQHLGIQWPLAMEASSLEAITQYVANGDGIGLTVNLSGVTKHPGVRVLPLEGFAPMKVGAYWHGSLTPLLRAFLDEAQQYVQQHWPAWQCDDPLSASAEAVSRTS